MATCRSCPTVCGLLRAGTPVSALPCSPCRRRGSRHSQKSREWHRGRARDEPCRRDHTADEKWVHGRGPPPSPSIACPTCSKLAVSRGVLLMRARLRIPSGSWWAYRRRRHGQAIGFLPRARRRRLTRGARFVERVLERHRGGPSDRPRGPTRAPRRSRDERCRCGSPNATWANVGERWPNSGTHRRAAFFGLLVHYGI
jgi:hypothetical protein